MRNQVPSLVGERLRMGWHMITFFFNLFVYTGPPNEMLFQTLFDLVSRGVAEEGDRYVGGQK